MKPSRHPALAFGALFASVLLASPALATPYAQTNLVSDVPGLAQLTDPNLRNPWGMSFSATSPFWISDQGTNTSTLYRVTNGVVSKVALTVAIPTIAGGPNGPTGQVSNNNTAAFTVGTTGASFIFANLNGQISAWNGSAGTTAQVKATTPGAVYTGLAISSVGSTPRLYAANGAQNRIDVFDGNFAPTTVPGGFVDPVASAAGLVPFNVQTIGTSVYVTYAPPGRANQLAATEGQGAVAVFDLNGNLISNIVSGGKLASPWGIAIAPVSFGGFGGALLVGNFSFAVSEINAFDLVTGAYLGTIGDNAGHALLNSGLWGIAFGNGATGDANTLYFNAGINGELNGLFGAIRVVPEPESLLLVAVGVGALMIGRRRRRIG